MYKGTTPTHIFNVSLDTTLIKEIKITYSQSDKEIFAKRTDDCTIEEGKISVKLTQEDTFLFECDKFVNIQVRILTLGGDCLTSSIVTVSVAKCLDNEVLV